MTSVAITFDIELPAGADQPEFARADLTFYGLDHSGPSYEVRVFFNHPDADSQTPLSADAGFAGRFSVFGHGGCFGEEGHCDIRPPVSAFDRRQPHPLTPAVRILTVTDAIRDLVQREAAAVTVTAVPIVRTSPLASADQSGDVLAIDQVALHTYE
jgi:tyrosinase